MSLGGLQEALYILLGVAAVACGLFILAIGLDGCCRVYRWFRLWRPIHPVVWIVVVLAFPPVWLFILIVMIGAMVERFFHKGSFEVQLALMNFGVELESLVRLFGLYRSITNAEFYALVCEGNARYHEAYLALLEQVGRVGNSLGDILGGKERFYSEIGLLLKRFSGTPFRDLAEDDFEELVDSFESLVGER